MHEVLDTVLAEAMARDVVHESYLPKLERVDIFDAIRTSGLSFSSATSERFPIKSEPSDMVPLSMDPQLLRYIHRNAVSNACKYGKKGGIVATRLRYDSDKKELQMKVTNEPGDGHSKIISTDLL